MSTETIYGCVFFTLYTILAIIEFGAGLAIGSEALVTDSYRNLFNASLWFLGVFTATADKRMRTKRNTFGWLRVEGFGKLFATIFASALYFSTSMNALQELFGASEKLDMIFIYCFLIFGLVGFTLDLMSYVLSGLHHRQKYEPESMKKTSLIIFQNEHNSFVLNGLNSVLILIIGSVLFVLNRMAINVQENLVDGLFTLFIVALQIHPIWQIAKDSMKILLQCAPKGLDLEKMEKDLKIEFPEIVNLHELHVWEVCSDVIVLTCHVILKRTYFEDMRAYTRKLQSFFKRRDVNMVTFQFELASNEDLIKYMNVKDDQNNNNNNGDENFNFCHFRCIKSKECEEKLCCIKRETKKVTDI